MSDDLSKPLEDELRRTSGVDGILLPDIDVVLRRGSRIRWRRRVAAGAVLSVVGVASALGAATVSGRFDRSARVNVAQRPGPAVSSAGADAVAVSVYALADVGLLDPEGDLYDYRYAISDEAGWTIGFDAVVCSATELVSSCAPNPGGDAELIVEQSDGGFVITEAIGPMTADQREALVGTRAPAPAGPPRWEFPSVVVGGPGGTSVVGVPLWIGSIPAPARGSTCTPKVLDSTGRAIWTGEPIDFVGPYREDERSGALQYHRPIPEGLDGERAVFSCGAWTASGWRVAGPPTVSSRGTERARVPVDVPVSWQGPAFAGVYTRCEARVFDAKGALVGEGETILVPPNGSTEAERARERTAQIAARVTSDFEPRTADVTCRVIHRVEYAEEW